MTKDIKNAVYVLDEVELDDGCPDQPFLFPGPRGVFELEVCRVDGASIMVPDRNTNRGQHGAKGEGVETVDRQHHDAQEIMQYNRKTRRSRSISLVASDNRWLEYEGGDRNTYFLPSSTCLDTSQNHCNKALAHGGFGLATDEKKIKNARNRRKFCRGEGRMCVRRVVGEGHCFPGSNKTEVRTRFCDNEQGE